MRRFARTIVVTGEHSGIPAIEQLVGQVVEVVEQGVDSDCDAYLVVRHQGRDHLIYEDQVSVSGIGS